MKVSLNWLRQYVELPGSLTIDQLCHDLTMRTVEVEGAESPAKALEGIAAGVITGIQPHPQADMLRVCQVDVGMPEPAVIVCGGSNVRIGMTVAVALPGARVRWHGEGEPVVIKPTKLRGVKSGGMICAASEMELDGLFPEGGEHEILDLSDFPAKPGDPVALVLGLDDIVLEIDNKSLTNRPDLWGHYGIARELSAIYACPLKPLPAFVRPNGLPEYPVSILSTQRCRRYAGLVYEGLDNALSPYWLRLALWTAGVRPISSLVDITNYTMLAVGQPTHGFDRNSVRREIIVRNARSGEQLTLLDGQTLKLTPEDLVICDTEEPVALAGIMGGQRDSILEDTGEMLLEIANFEPIGIRRSAGRFQIRTESAIRNEKGLDPQRADLAMTVADGLIRKLYPEAKLTAFTDRYPVRAEELKIHVKPDWLSTRLGRELGLQQISGLLTPLGFDIMRESDGLSVTVPSWRATGDIKYQDDILEEVARMIGYDQFDFIPPAVLLTGAVSQPRVLLERRIREYLSFQCGMQEVFTYPWVSRKYIAAAGIQPENCLQLATPPSPDTACLRPSLVPGLLATAALNMKYFDDFSIYEMTQVFAQGSTHPSEAGESLPLQRKFLAAGFVGADPRTLFRTAKGVLECLPRAVMAEPLSFEQRDKPDWADQKAWLNILLSGEVIGSLGIVARKTARAADMKRGQMALFEINADMILPLPSRSNKFESLPLYPLVEQDFSVTLDESVSWERITALIQGYVKSIGFIEEYRGKQIPEGKKSIMFRVRFGSEAGTMTAAQIDEKMRSIIKKLGSLGGEVRR